MSYRYKEQFYEAMQYTGTNGTAMINFAPTVISQDLATRKLYLTVGDVSTEIIATTWIVIHPDWWENVRDQYFHKKYEEVIP